MLAPTAPGGNKQINNTWRFGSSKDTIPGSHTALPGITVSVTVIVFSERAYTPKKPR